MADLNSQDFSSQASINKLSFNDSNGLSNIFAIGGASSSSANIQFSLTQREAAFVNEVGVFVVSDDKGTVNGIAPGQQGYTEAALSQSRVIFSSLSEKAAAGINFVRQLSFKAGERLGFYLVANDTTDNVDAKRESGKTPDNVFFSLSASNSDKFDHVRVEDQGNSTFNLAWEDLKGGGDKDFNDLGLKMQLTNTPAPVGTGLQGQRQGEIIDLRGLSGQFSANFTLNSDFANQDFVGLYKVNDAQGTVTDPSTGKTITPGEVGYAQAAIRQSVLSFNNKGISPTTLDGGGLLVPFIIANGNIEQFLSQNTNNQPGTGLQAYFPYLKANSDNIDHIRLLGDNTFAFEDSFNGANSDFNDMVFQVNLTAINSGNGTTTNPGGNGGTTNPGGNGGTTNPGGNGGTTGISVSISAIDPTATELLSGTVKAGTFRISRTGDTSAGLNVNLAVDPTSTVTSNPGGLFGVDYTLGGGNITASGTTRTVTIPVGQSFVDVTLTPTDDGGYAEADETLKLNLAANPASAYNIDSSGTSATVTIAANGTKVIDTNDSATGDYTKIEGSLRQALINANASVGIKDDITFNNIPITDPGYSNGTYTIKLAAALPNITDDVNITGLGANKLTVSGNNAVRVLNIDSGKTVNIADLTIANGQADNGGGILNNGTLTLTNSTLAGNKATIDGGGILNTGTGTVKAKNTIIAKNTAVSGVDFSGTLTSQGNNLIGNNSGIIGNLSGDIIGNLLNILNLNSLLSPLASNGGSTQTIALLPGSLAINAGDNSVVTAGIVPNTDQRGNNRINGISIDIGAYEA